MKTKIALFLVSILFVGLAEAQNKQIPLIGSKAPSFTAQSTVGEFTFPDDFGASWKILFSHPKDFTPVCSSELLELAYLYEELAKMNVKFAVISTDEVNQHHMWKAHLEELDYKNRGKQQIHFPLIEDPNMQSSIKYGMLHSPASTSRDIRGVYILDPNNIVRSINFYPIEVGRNMLEIERTIAALQTADATKMLTPANWELGDDMLVPYYPYTSKDLAEDPSLQNDYYNVGDRMWFKKSTASLTSR